MIIISKIVGIDNKFGRKSRTGSNISIGVKDELAHDAQTYLMALEKDGELTGKIKKIELVIYEDGDELETIESLRAENKELKFILENVGNVVENTETINKALNGSGKNVVTKDDETPKLKSLKCTCGKTYEWANVFYGDEYSNIEYKCSCGCTTVGGKELTAMVLLWAGIQNDTSKLKFFIENVLEEEFHEKPNEHLPPNQTYLKLYEKSCKCETSAIVNGKCANCGGME